MICAALDGIKNNLVPPEEVKENLFTDPQSHAGIETLPDTLDSAKEIAQSSSFVKDVLGF